MDRNEIETVRAQGFTVDRRGYDPSEVDKFLSALIDWLDTDAAKELGGMAIERKLELAGKATAQILLTTERESEHIRLQTEEECAELRSRAEAESLEAKRAADEYATQVREKAEQDARRTGQAAGAHAKRTIEEAARRRAQLEAVVGDLDARRAGALRDLERLHTEVGSTIEKQPSGERSDRRNGEEDGQASEAAKEPETLGKP